MAMQDELLFLNISTHEYNLAAITHPIQLNPISEV